MTEDSTERGDCRSWRFGDRHISQVQTTVDKLKVGLPSPAVAVIG